MRRTETGEELLLIGVIEGRRMQISRQTVTSEASEAAVSGRSLNDACPYPFCSEAGKYFRYIFDSKGGKR